jgi:VIT1/CCC1 family predicted Fe2+/Mn2+ transporter
VIHPQELEAIRLKWLQLPALPRRPRLEKDDLVGAVAVFLLVFVSIFPVVIPFLLTHNVMLALRLSNAIAIAMLFWVGCSLGRYAGYVPWHVGVSMVTIGLVLVGITILLGG